MQEAIAVELRRAQLLPLNDLLVVVREFINAQGSRSGLQRCLQRHGAGQLRELQRLSDRKGSGAAEPSFKTSKSHVPSFLQIDIKYTPQRA